MSDQEQPVTQHPQRPAEVIIYWEPAPERRPPVTETGVIGWLSKNLFGSVADTILTLVALLVIVFVAQALLKWSIADAEWTSVTHNLRLFMNGRYPVPQIGRVKLIMAMLVFLSGLTWRIVGRVPRGAVIGTAILLLILYGVPIFTNQIHHTPTYLYANAASQRGDLNVAFLFKADDDPTLSLTPADPAEGILTGFSDTVSATEAGQAEQAINNYQAQLARSETDPAIEAPEPLPDPDVGVTVRVLDANLEEVAVLAAGNQEATSLPVDIPDDGWYVMTFEITGEYGAYWLEVDTYEIFTSGGEALAPRVEKYGEIPTIEGERVETGDSGFLRFRGSRTFKEFMRLQVGPFFEAARELVLTVAIVTALGYLVGIVVARLPRPRTIMQILWGLSLFATIILLRGFNHGEYMALVRLIAGLAVVVPALFGYLNASFFTREGQNGVLVLGVVVVVLSPLLFYLANVAFAVAAAVAALGVVLIWFSLDNRSRWMYVRWMVISLGIALACFLLAQLALNSSVEDELAFVPTDRWGGVVLTLALAVVSISASFPIGVLLALGRRSELPVIKLFCVGAIEFVRGVPLITILFMTDIMVPWIWEGLADVDNVVRAMFGMTFFSAAYVAEVVRGGLQAVPSGQTEAAKAVGMSGWQTTVYIVLPQALRAVIPALVGQFISLFKDTSLVFIIGLIELLGVARTVYQQAEFIGTQKEVLIFIGIIYFIGSYAMSYTSRRIEETGSGAARRL